MQTIANKINYGYESIEEAFPDIPCGHAPHGPFVIVQIRAPKFTTRGGIEIPDEVRQTEYYNTQIAKVIAIGDAAFRSRQTGEMWPEGPWFAVGDYVRCPKYGGDRWSVTYTRIEPERQVGNLLVAARGVEDDAVFAMFKDLDIRMRITSDPLRVKAFLD